MELASYRQHEKITFLARCRVLAWQYDQKIRAGQFRIPRHPRKPLKKLLMPDVLSHALNQVVARGSRHPQLLTLAAPAYLMLDVIDQLVSFARVRATNVYFEPLQFYLQKANLLA
jgi:hypothetical protein